jgi:hypothetical protein
VITGTDELKSAAQIIQQNEENSRWQHPEKQKTLIHTAPVFTPQQNSSGELIYMYVNMIFTYIYI